MNSERLARGELVGLDIKVVGKNISGRVIDETRSSILIETKKGKKMAIKENNHFEFTFLGKKQVVDGKLLALRPEERIKRKVNL